MERSLALLFVWKGNWWSLHFCLLLVMEISFIWMCLLIIFTCCTVCKTSSEIHYKLALLCVILKSEMVCLRCTPCQSHVFSYQAILGKLLPDLHSLLSLKCEKITVFALLSFFVPKVWVLVPLNSFNYCEIGSVQNVCLQEFYQIFLVCLFLEQISLVKEIFDLSGK